MDKQLEMPHILSSLIECYHSSLGSLPGGASVISARDNVIEQMKEVGIPSRKIEYWHYTDLPTLIKTIPAFENEDKGSAVTPLFSKSPIFATFNGKTLNNPQLEGVNSYRLAEALAQDQYVFNEEIAQDDFIGQLNTAFVTDGWLININAKTNFENPIELQNIHTKGQSHSRSHVTIGGDSRVTIVERDLGDDQLSLTSSINLLTIAENSEVSWVIVRDRDDHSLRFSKFQSVLAKGAKLTLYVINVASQLNRQEIEVELQGEKSDFQLRVINLLADKTHSDITMVVRHSEEQSTSNEIIRNVVTDHAKGAFQGMIKVSQKAQKTDARMACNSLILSDFAEFNAKPELEIFADDVACGHGATVAEIDHNHLFYLMARGIPLPLARGLLVKAFVSELIDDIAQEDQQGVLESIIDSWLERNL
ncbi:Fe-S cluster assembly protein SufD [Bartonella tamiae]|uniref:FeS assembly protein SufD n=1 Tax=Bartonella tamiae Th239 TaxID=1094558 RepID=J0ZKJ8_9HYPH|nr:Fe-S cluster assembly protein SufD [Bartonella tamiae]EJF88883.1 FeS assembly protein SufD [Bartonella tamiae Th239]EJF94867.1 FeS assembly protein SufD [Bartonella tamiae Th307]